MQNTSNLAVTIGLIMILLTAMNSISVSEITPSIQRAEIISALTSVSILFIGILIRQNNYNITQNKKDIKGNEGFFLYSKLTSDQKNELAWGTQMVLTNTPTCSLLIFIDDQVIVRRGLINDSKFVPGNICKTSAEREDYIALVSTKFYPGRNEFDTIAKDLPSIIVFPIGKKGWIIVGGWSERCYTKTDELWIDGWAKKLVSII